MVHTVLSAAKEANIISIDLEVVHETRRRLEAAELLTAARFSQFRRAHTTTCRHPRKTARVTHSNVSHAKSAWCLARFTSTVSMTSATCLKLSLFVDHAMTLIETN